MNINYKLGNGSLITSQQKDIGQTIALPNWNNVFGYTFIGWQCGDTIYQAGTTVGPEDWNVRDSGYRLDSIQAQIPLI